ncbi:Guanylate-binding protein 2 [Ananas comosus]|uniref:Guanylate-binding protein 2 n=1 Tax=Ananas comosus TaxID=4615 RepID=A0A199W4S7_ANACO|nr:Guanylate-binding protein 2 [Ananas comosus]
MMQMLRFHSGSASKDRNASPTSDPRNPNPSPSPRGTSASPSPSYASTVAPGTVGPGRPLRLVYCDERGKFQMDPEAVAALHLVKSPIGVVSVCGRARQGKSFILNQGTYSIQVFSLAVLLSSLFIYNQMGGIDEAALDRLSLVTEMTKHIRVKAAGGRSTTSEIGQFSPVFVWLLRDFYLDLAEDNRKITPRDYLELALRPIQGRGKDVSSKNEIRESIRALFPDRDCFTLVRPLNNENELRHLDQIPSVEEAECRRAYDYAAEVYMSSFDRTKPADEDVLREAHEDALQKSLASFNASAVGAGSVRTHYEKLLHNFCRKAFEEYKRSAFLEADRQCSNAIQSMEKKIRAACLSPGAIVSNIIGVLESLLAEYETSSHGPGKWKILATFVRQCIEGPIMDLFIKQLNQAESERSALALKCRSNEDKLELLKKHHEANEKQRSEYLKRYEEATADKQKVSDDLSGRISNLRSKCSTLEERCMSISKELDLARRESSDWRVKYEQSLLEQKNEEEKFAAQRAALESRYSAAEGKLAAAREQAASADEEASEWRQKYEMAAAQAKSALERASAVQEKTNKLAQDREDVIRAELAAQFKEKEEQIKNMKAKFENAESHTNVLVERLEAAEAKVQSQDEETAALKAEIKELNEKLVLAKARTQSYEKEIKILEQEKKHIQENYLSISKKIDDAVERCSTAERDAKRVIASADAAQAEAVVAQQEKSEAQRLSIERLTVIERIQRKASSLEQDKSMLFEQVRRLRQSETDALSKVTLLERRVDERESEIEELLNRSNEQRSNTVQVLETLLATERAARAEANNRAEALSLQLQSTQGKLDALHQELTSVRLVETALDSKLRTASHNKRLRVDNEGGTESMQDMDVDGQLRGRKRSKSTTSPLKFVRSEDGGSVYKADENLTPSLEAHETDNEDYTKYTVLKLKKELTKHGFGAQLLELRNPNKKEILALYEKHVLGKA